MAGCYTGCDEMGKQIARRAIVDKVPPLHFLQTPAPDLCNEDELLSSDPRGGPGSCNTYVWGI